MRWPRVIRPATSADLPFIVDSWLRSYLRNGDPSLRAIRGPLFFENERKGVAQLLERPGAKVVVAHWPDEQNHILGWAAGQAGLLYFCYVVFMYRKDGIGVQLISEVVGGEAPFEFLFHTRAMAARARKWNCRYNPYRR